MKKELEIGTDYRTLFALPPDCIKVVYQGVDMWEVTRKDGATMKSSALG